jgi:cell division protein FtsN
MVTPTGFVSVLSGRVTTGSQQQPVVMGPTNERREAKKRKGKKKKEKQLPTNVIFVGRC